MTKELGLGKLESWLNTWTLQVCPLINLVDFNIIYTAAARISFNHSPCVFQIRKYHANPENSLHFALRIPT